MKAIRYWLLFLGMFSACLPWTDLVLTKPGTSDEEPIDTDGPHRAPGGDPVPEPKETGQSPADPPNDTYEREEPEDTYELWFED